MRPSFKSAAALAGAAVLLVGVTAASSQGSSSNPAEAKDAPASVTYKLGQRADIIDFGSAWQLDVKPGTYMVSLRATMFLGPNDQEATAASIICGLIDVNTLDSGFTRIYFAETATQIQAGPPAALSGSSVMRVTKKMTPGVVCFLGDGSFQLYQPITATFTELGKRTYGESSEVPINFGGKQLKHKLRNLFTAHPIGG
jgi:hypothetical protein